ncbi:MAG: type IX secretion system sortase PorU [Candidatus Eisenbacteria bacterium]
MSPSPVADARLLASSSAGVSFEVDVPAPVLSTLETASGSYHQLELEGFAWDGAVGQPLLPARALTIAVPIGARVFVSASGEGERIYDGLRLVPQQSAEWAGLLTTSGARVLNAMTEDRAAYARSGYGDTPLATLDGVTGMRAQRIARITVRPASYDPALGRVRLYTRVRVSVRFEGGAAEAPALAPLLPAEMRADPFEDTYRTTLLNYESGRSWREDLGANTLRRRGLTPNARPQAAGAGGNGAVREDFTSSPNWIRLDVSAKGVYKVDAVDLAGAGASLAAIDPRTIRVFTRPGIPLLDELTAPSGWLSEVSVNVVGEADGRFDTTDYLLFFGLGISGWKDEFTSPLADSGYINHPYDTKNVYWLTWGGAFANPPRRWATRSGAPELPFAWTTPSYPARIHFEQDNEYQPNLQAGGSFHEFSGIFWEKWVWLNVKQRSGPVPFGFNLPGAVTTRPARFKARLWGTTSTTHRLNVSLNGVPFTPRVFFGNSDNGRQDYDTTFTDVRTLGNQLRVQCDASSADEVSLFWYDVNYARTLTPTGNALDFRSPDTTAAVAYGLGPFPSTSGFLLLDTTDPLGPTQITGVVERDTTGGKAVYFHDDVTSKRDYLALGASALKRPDAITRVQIDDLLAPTNGADYVVITNDAFTGPAQALAARRATFLPGVPNPRSRVVKISDIYAWYSGGRLDPTAIRNFVYDTVRGVGWSPAPSFVCFIGDASYDYKNVYHQVAQGTATNMVPTYPNGYQTAQFSTDDWLVDLDLGVREPYPNGPPPGYPDSVNFDVPDLAVGRIPAATLAEADFMIRGKILPYETAPDFGEWRRRALMLADDITQGFAPDGLGTEHMFRSEIIANNDLPDELETRKIYLIRYPYGSGPEKPLVKRDVIDAVNSGMLFWNYIGHGNPFKMADENAFILSDVGSLNNLKELTFLIAASCDLGKFDDAIVTGLGEALLKSRNGGAIATFSATDIAFAFSNAALAEQLFVQMFKETPAGFQVPLGLAVLKAKMRPATLSINDNKYVLMGDPGMRLAMPDRFVRVALNDAETNAPVDSLRRGRRIHVHGDVSPTHDPLATDLDAAFNGVASILVTDSPPTDSVTAFTGTLRYTYDPGVIFHGDANVVNGQFDATFIVPLEALTGPKARVIAYLTTGSNDGAGAQLRPLAAGASAVVDTTGPTIGLAFLNGLKVVPPDATLRIVVRDEHGVNLTGHTIPNSLFLTIDGTSRFDLTKDFRYDVGSYQSGSVEFTLPGLEAGPHSITVSAADNYAQGVLARKNRSTASIDFEVTASTDFSLGRVYNFPNPFRPNAGGTSFVVTGLTEPARVLVKVYTVSGALVRRLETVGGPGQVQLLWDGRDEQGARVANGAYLYQVAAEGQSSGRTARFRGQAAALE